MTADAKTCPACRSLESPSPDEELCPTHAAAVELAAELRETVAWLETVAEAIGILKVRGRYSASGKGNVAQVLAAKVRGRARLIESILTRARLAPRT